MRPTSTRTTARSLSSGIGCSGPSRRGRAPYGTTVQLRSYNPVWANLSISWSAAGCFEPAGRGVIASGSGSRIRGVRRMDEQLETSNSPRKRDCPAKYRPRPSGRLGLRARAIRRLRAAAHGAGRAAVVAGVVGAWRRGVGGDRRAGGDARARGVATMGCPPRAHAARWDRHPDRVAGASLRPRSCWRSWRARRPCTC